MSGARRFTHLVRATKDFERAATQLADETSAMLTQAEIDECKAAFHNADKDASGNIDHAQLHRALIRLGQHTTEEELYQIIAEVDTDKRGSVNLSAFLRVMESQKRRAMSFDAERDVVHAFVAVGGHNDKSGEVSVADLQKVINEDFDLDADVTKLVERVHSGRTTGNTRISFDEFSAMLL